MAEIILDRYNFPHLETVFEGRTVWIDTFSTKLTIFQEVGAVYVGGENVFVDLPADPAQNRPAMRLQGYTADPVIVEEARAFFQATGAIR